MMACSLQSSKLYPPHESSDGDDNDDDLKIHESQLYPRAFRISDSQQMVWVLIGNSLTTVPASNNVKPVLLSLIACRNTGFEDNEKGNLVFLGIEDKNLCLYCAEVGGTPTLQLKNVNIMDMYKESKPDKAFLFYHSIEGSTASFQSVSYPGWFIATSQTARQAIILTNQRGEANNTNFYLEPEY